MKKLKLLTPIMSLITLAGATSVMVGCSCNKTPTAKATITLSETSKTLKNGASFILEATISGSEGNIDWGIENPTGQELAIGTKIDNTHYKVTASKVGSIKVNAKLTADVSASCDVTIEKVTKEEWIESCTAAILEAVKPENITEYSNEQLSGTLTGEGATVTFLPNPITGYEIDSSTNHRKGGIEPKWKQNDVLYFLSDEWIPYFDLLKDESQNVQYKITETDFTYDDYSVQSILNKEVTIVNMSFQKSGYMNNILWSAKSELEGFSFGYTGTPSNAYTVSWNGSAYVGPTVSSTAGQDIIFNIYPTEAHPINSFCLVEEGSSEPIPIQTIDKYKLTDGWSFDSSTNTFKNPSGSGTSNWIQFKVKVPAAHSAITVKVV